MDTKMRDTSLEAYDSIRGKLNKKQREVYNAIERMGKCTDRQLAAFLCWDINRVTGRRNELVEKNAVREVGKVRDFETNRMACQWCANQYEEQGKLNLT